MLSMSALLAELFNSKPSSARVFDPSTFLNKVVKSKLKMKIILYLYEGELQYV
jgi:hypothetical protein